MSRQLAARLGKVAPSPTLAMAQEAAKLKAQGVSVIDFSLGEPDLDSPAPVKAAGIKAIEANLTHYAPAQGYPDLRTALAEHYTARTGVACKASEFMVGPGAKSVLFATMMALVDPGDDVVLVAPYWVSFPEQIKLAGGNPVVAASRWDDGFTTRAAAIKAALTPRTKVLILCAPSNPTGGILPAEEAEQIVELALERDLWVVSDETYEAFFYDPADALSMLRYRDRLGDRLIMTSAFSKTWAMTGWRVGYAMASEAVVKALVTIQSHDATQAASMCQKAALAALKEAADAPQAMLEEYRGRRDLVLELLGQIDGVRCLVPKGAFYAYPDVSGAMARRGFKDSVEFSTALLKEQAVAVVPGEAFGTPGFIRISYATSRDNLREGLTRLKAFCEG